MKDEALMHELVSLIAEASGADIAPPELGPPDVPDDVWQLIQRLHE